MFSFHGKNAKEYAEELFADAPPADASDILGNQVKQGYLTVGQAEDIENLIDEGSINFGK